MPPYKIRVQCCECTYEITGWQLQALSKADNHARKQHHMLTATREYIHHGHMATEINYIYPPRN